MIENKINLSDIFDVRDLPINYNNIAGFPQQGVELTSLDRTAHVDYDDAGNKIPGSEDASRVRKLVFNCLPLDNILRSRKMVEAKIGTKTDYVNGLASLKPFELTINGEADCKLFLDHNSNLVNDVDSGKVVDVTSGISLKPLFSMRGYSRVVLTFDDLSTVAYKLFNAKTFKYES